jgi:flagellin
MAMVINTNIMSLNAQRNLGKSGSTLATAMQRLSSGLRINSAKDDAAGLAISNRMSTQVRGLTQAIRNANDGISISQTAEGAMQEITNNLQRARELAVQSANGSNSASDRAALNDEVTQLVSEIQRAATTTTFNGVNVLNGSFTGNSLQVGSQAGETISFSIANMQTTALGVGSSSSYSASITTATEVGATALSSGDLTLNGFEVGAAAEDGVSLNGTLTYFTTGASAIDSAASGIAVANAINAITGDTGVTATVNATSVAGTAATGFATAITAGSVLINGVDIGSLSAGTAAIDRGADMAAAINAVSDQTGVTATFATTGAVSLTASDGRNITIEYGLTTASTDVITGLGYIGAASSTGSSDTTRSTVDLSSTSQSGITVGGDNEALAGLTDGLTAATVTVGAGVSSIDISTAGGASNALDIIDSALARVDAERAKLGAIQNRLESTMSNLGSITENVSAARSRVLDADFAAETAAMTRAQILQQAGVSMLAQANSAPQNVLSLLQ